MPLAGLVNAPFLKIQIKHDCLAVSVFETYSILFVFMFQIKKRQKCFTGIYLLLVLYS